LEQAMANLQIESDLPIVTPAQGLTGWHWEFCVELLEDQAARVFVRAVEKGSSKAAELRRAVLFCRLGSSFSDLAGCVASVRNELERLADTSRRLRPTESRGSPFSAAHLHGAAPTEAVQPV
jgi:hypothetical protein